MLASSYKRHKKLPCTIAQIFFYTYAYYIIKSSLNKIATTITQNFHFSINSKGLAVNALYCFLRTEVLHLLHSESVLGKFVCPSCLSFTKCFFLLFRPI